MAGGNHRNGGLSFSNGGSTTSLNLKGSLYSTNGYSSSSSSGVKVTTATSSDRQFSSSVNSSLKSSGSSSFLKPKPRRSSTGSAAGSNGLKYDSGVGTRVRVAVRLRPRNAEESVADADLPDCVELQPELKRLKLRRNNWDSDTFEFDEVLTEFASQKRVYEVVAKPVVESVLEGYNGTVMAYGQTGTGKTYTLGLLGDEDTSARGIMVRALEDILAEISPETDHVSVSYLQLYMETIQDLLRPENDNISIVEDPKTGDLSLPGATIVEIKDQKSFVELLRVGEAHRFAANTKLNTESSRSHAILMVQVKRFKGKDSALSNENGSLSHSAKPSKPIVRRGKFVVVDLAGSERIDKSGSEGHTLEEAKAINLSLSALGKCINALAENSPHVPVRDSKLTRLLRDSFGGSARTSLIVTIGPSPQHRGETASTIMFGQRAMKVENMLKIKEEFDYKSLSRRLDIQLDKLIAENERKQKAFQDEIERIALEAQKHIAEVERNYADSLEKERMKIEKEYMDLTEKLQEQLNVQGMHQNGEDGFLLRDDIIDKMPDEMVLKKYPKLLAELEDATQLLQNETLQRKAAEEEIFSLRNQLAQWKKLEAAKNSEILKLRKMLEDESHEKVKLEEEIVVLQNRLLQISFEADERSRKLDKDESAKLSDDLSSLISQANHQSLGDLGDGEKASMAKLFEQVGLQKILSLLDSEDADVRIHAVKVVANLAAEESNQQRIVEAGGLTSLLMLLRRCDDETIQRVAAGAIANLAMNETNQELIVAQGGINLLSMTAANADDPQTLRMVAGAIANLCGNDKLPEKLRCEGGIKALLGMVKCRHPDVLAQVARGVANFAKCESRALTQGTKMGRSLLIEDGALPWIVQNANNEALPIRRHIELALCHLAQHEANAKDMISAGAVRELVRVSRDCPRDDIKNLAGKTLTSSPTFIAELKRQRVNYG